MRKLPVLYEDADLRIQGIHDTRAGDSGIVTLSFTGVNGAMGGVSAQKPEFVGAGARIGAAFFISDLNRSWGNRVDFSRIERVVGPHLAGRTVVALGNSMGGFLSVLAANLLPVDVVIAFASRYRLRPVMARHVKAIGVGPAAIETTPILDLAGRFNDRVRYTMISGTGAEERMHWRRFPAQANVANVVIEGVGHYPAPYLKQVGVLQAVIGRCIEGTFSVDWLASVCDRAVYAAPTRTGVIERLREAAVGLMTRGDVRDADAPAP